jgi:hypothetical protein
MMHTLLRRRPLEAGEQPERIDYSASLKKGSGKVEISWCRGCNNVLGRGKCDRCVVYDVMGS